MNLDSSSSVNEMLTIHSSTSGDVVVPASAVMQFVLPLWGFSDERAFALVPAARDGLWWLMGVEAPHTTFVLADPFAAFPEYAVDLSEVDREALELPDASAALVLVMLTLPAVPDVPATANLRAPLVFHVARQHALQVVNPDDRHSLQQPLALSVYPLHEAIDSPSA